MKIVILQHTNKIEIIKKYNQYEKETTLKKKTNKFYDCNNK